MHAMDLGSFKKEFQYLRTLCNFKYVYFHRFFGKLKRDREIQHKGKYWAEVNVVELQYITT